MKGNIRRASPYRKLRRRSQWALMMGSALAASTARSAVAAPVQDQHAGDPAPQTASAPTDARVLRFSIAPGPLDGALAEFQRVTGLKVVLSNPGINSVQS